MQRTPHIFESVYFIMEVIADNQYSTTFHVLSQLNIKLVLKLFKSIAPNTLFENELQNCQILCGAQNPDFIRYISSSRNEFIDDENFIVFELAEKGSLDDYLNHIMTFDENSKKIIFWKIAKMVERLHHLKYCHRNLNFSNILVNQQYHLKLGSFGSAKFYANQNDEFEKAKKDDIKSLGIMLRSLVTDKIDFKYKTNFWSLLSFNKSELNISQDFKNLVDSMLDDNYQNRPYFPAIFGNSYFDSVRNQEDFQASEINLIERFRELDEFLHP